MNKGSAPTVITSDELFARNVTCFQCWSKILGGHKFINYSHVETSATGSLIKQNWDFC